MSSFSPLVSPCVEPKILILGSWPSESSFAQAQYYAHPRNQFWWLMAQLLHMPETLSYQQQCQALTQAGFALWDVIAQCQRKGSLDSAIDTSSVRVNAIDDFLKRHASVQAVCFNGGAAYRVYKKHFPDLLRQCDYTQLPSTSPAYATLTREAKLNAWQEAFYAVRKKPAQ